MVNNTIKHIAIIMDGNGRWARKRGLPRLKGHKEGVGALEDTVEYVAKHHPNATHLTVYAFAIKNQTREPGEVAGLAALFDQQVNAMLPNLIDNNVRARVVGDRKDPYFTPELLGAIAKLEEGTKGCTGLNLQIAWNYSGQNEIIRAQAAGWDISRLYETMFDAPHVPPINLMVRTGVDNEVGLNMRDSDFFPLLSSGAVKVPTARLWPEFKGEIDLEEAMAIWHAEAHLEGGQRPEEESKVAAQ